MFRQTFGAVVVLVLVLEKTVTSQNVTACGPAGWSGQYSRQDVVLSGSALQTLYYYFSGLTVDHGSGMLAANTTVRNASYGLIAQNRNSSAWLIDWDKKRCNDVPYNPAARPLALRQKCLPGNASRLPSIYVGSANAKLSVDNWGVVRVYPGGYQISSIHSVAAPDSTPIQEKMLLYSSNRLSATRTFDFFNITSDFDPGTFRVPAFCAQKDSIEKNVELLRAFF